MDSFQEQLDLSPDNCPGTTQEPGATVCLGGRHHAHLNLLLYSVRSMMVESLIRNSH